MERSEIKTGWKIKLAIASLFAFAFILAFAFIPEMTETAFATELMPEVYYIDHEDGPDESIIESIIGPLADYNNLNTNSAPLWNHGTCVVSGKPVIITQLTVTKRDGGNGNVNLILMDDTRLVVQNGIHVEEGATLNIYAGGKSKTIRGNGELYAGYTKPRNNTGAYLVPTRTVSTNVAAGIGGYSLDTDGQFLNDYHNCGKVVIHGGIIKAAGMRGGAGIGGGNGGDGVKANSGDKVEIYKGVVAATGSVGGAGIGGGGGNATKGSGGQVTYYNGGKGSTVKIYGGSVEAIGSGIKNPDGEFIAGGAGIGGGNGGNDGNGSNGGYVSVNGGMTKAVGVSGTGGVLSPGIGGGSNTLQYNWLQSDNILIWTNNEDIRPVNYGGNPYQSQYVWIENPGDAYYTEHVRGPEDKTSSKAKSIRLENDKYTVVRYSADDITWDGSRPEGAVYVVKEDSAVSGNILVRGKVSLILSDGKTMYARKGIHLENDAELNIYAGSESETIKGTGILKAAGGIIDNSIPGKVYPDRAEAGIGGNGTVAINGGSVNSIGGGFTSPALTPGSGGAFIGGNAGAGIGGDGCRVIINGGFIEARGGDGNDSGDSAPAPIGGGAGIGGDGSSVIINGGSIS